MKLLFILLGSFSLVIGIIGIFVPLLPTVPFLLFTSFCYLKSSNTLHAKFVNNKIFGKHIKDYESGKGIPVKIKISTLLFLWTSILYSVFFIISLVKIKIVLIAIAIAVSVHIITLKAKNLN